MPRFFFHLYDDEVPLDAQGRELPDAEAAREEAVRDARDIACADVLEGHLGLNHRIEVTDVNDAPLDYPPWQRRILMPASNGRVTDGSHMQRSPPISSAKLESLLDERERLHITISVAADDPRPDPGKLYELSISLAELECAIADERKRLGWQSS